MNRLRALRTSEGLTSIQTAKILQLSESAVRYIERGERGFSMESLQRACNHFHVSTDYMLGKSAEEMYNGFVESIHNDFSIVTLDPESGAVEDISEEVDPTTRAKLWVLFTLQEIKNVGHIYEVRDCAKHFTAVEDFSTPLPLDEDFPPENDDPASPEAVKLQNEIISFVRQIKNAGSLEVLLTFTKARLATEDEDDNK